MSSVTQLRRTADSLLADASGAPRPVVAAPLLPAGATVVQLRPSPEPEAPSTTPPPAPPSTALPSAPAGPEEHKGHGSEAVPGGHGTIGSPASPALEDGETMHRMAGIARCVAQGALEVLAGSRPLQQLSRWLDPENYERLQLRANLVRCINGSRTAGAGPSCALRQVVVRSARVCRIDDGVFEASVVAYDQKRVRAVALRIERRRGTWRVTALEIG
ncbi:Rv3235 family protein [Arthrobacter agilis]|uniref:Rv3235 family protein n=1 Tax=Arthrobacter agilis TaxID=37921 RepID=UPI00236700E9|nr:Rv3235 family protein [Arthrobacter agilis]WDF32419.1 Rv3235 family protein [Arthrobacter agilis]